MNTLQQSHAARGPSMARALRVWCVRVAMLGLVGAWPVAGAAQAVYFTPQAVLRDFFATSTRVTYRRIQTQEHAGRLRERLGYVPTQREYVVFVAYSGDAIDGYAVVDDEQGQHQPITFAIKLGVDGRVQRVEIMVYREGYGSEIRDPRFVSQFVGKGPADAMRLGADVMAVSGATISSKSASIAVKRATALVELLR